MCLKMQTRYSPAYLNRNNYLYNQDCPSSDRPMFGGGIVFFLKEYLVFFSLNCTFVPNEGCFDAFAPLAMV